MTLGALFITFFTAGIGAQAIRIGVISNASLMMSSSNITLIGANCNECLCTMLDSSSNLSILSLNCLINNISTVVCQLFTNTTYLSSNFFEIAMNFNSTFYFRELPPNKQSTTVSMVNSTEVIIDQTSEITTATAPTTSTNINCSTPANNISVPAQCSNYILNTDGTRNAAGTSDNSCDNSTFSSSPIWVRFCGEAGTLLANYPVAPSHCGTESTGWYSGVYPSTVGDTTNGTVCYNWYGSTCVYSNSISVTNCSGYYVYALINVSTCNLRYCTIS